MFSHPNSIKHIQTRPTKCFLCVCACQARTWSRCGWICFNISRRIGVDEFGRAIMVFYFSTVNVKFLWINFVCERKVHLCFLSYIFLMLNLFTLLNHKCRRTKRLFCYQTKVWAKTNWPKKCVNHKKLWFLFCKGKPYQRRPQIWVRRQYQS